MYKFAGHVEDRVEQRAPGAMPEVNSVRRWLANNPDRLKKQQTYHAPLKGGRGYVVVGDVSKRLDDKPLHVVKTVYAPYMPPPGELLKLNKQACLDLCDDVLLLFLSKIPTDFLP